MIYLAIAEDHQALIDGIQLHLSIEPNIKIVGTANNGEDLLQIIKDKNPTVVLTDIRMPKMDGITLTKEIKKFNPKISIIAFTMFDQEEAVHKMINAGVSGYLLKSASLDDVKEAILTVSRGEIYFDSNLNIDLTCEIKAKGVLTKRQNEILSLIGEGKSSREIADILHIGVQTVDTHRKNMSRILNLRGKGELLRYALDKKYKF